MSGRRKVHDADRGMAAVERVRQVREHDSRVGLQQALTAQQAREARLAQVEAELATAPPFTTGTGAAFLAARATLGALAASAADARAEAASGATVTEAARQHWLADKSRLTAVEKLLERRAEERRAEAARQEAARLDEAAGQLWQRARRTSSPATRPHPSEGTAS